MIKQLFAAVVFFCAGPGLANADDLNSAGLTQLKIPAGQPAAMPVPPPAPVYKRAAAQPAADPVLNGLSEDQWNAIFNGPVWEDDAAGEQGQNRELFGDYHVRYIVKGKVSFATNPPTFTADTGKVFKIVKYPKWLKDVGDARICVEGYAKQRDATEEFVIKKLLAPDALDHLMPAGDMQAVQRDPSVMAHNAAGYVLGNVNWNLVHDKAGKRARDSYGNMMSEWASGVKVKPELMEQAFFVKKTSLKPIRYGDHGMLMFTFKRGGVTTADGKPARGLAISLDAYYKDISNMSYSPIAALKGKYLVYYSIQTMERYSEFKVAEDANTVMQLYPLKLSRAQQAQVLDAAIAKAVDNNKGEAYNLFYNSCANSALSIINSVLPKDKKIKEGWLPEIVYRLKTTLPDSIAALLMKKGIAGKPMPEVNTANYQTAYNY